MRREKCRPGGEAGLGDRQECGTVTAGPPGGECSLRPSFRRSVAFATGVTKPLAFPGCPESPTCTEGAEKPKLQNVTQVNKLLSLKPKEMEIKALARRRILEI